MFLTKVWFVFSMCAIREQKDFSKSVLLAERIILNTLGFELNVAHPLMVCGAKVKDLRGKWCCVFLCCSPSWDS